MWRLYPSSSSGRGFGVCFGGGLHGGLLAGCGSLCKQSSGSLMVWIDTQNMMVCYFLGLHLFGFLLMVRTGSQMHSL